MSGDTTPAQIIPLSLLQYGDIFCDHFISYFNTPDNLYAFVNIHGHYFSYFPIVTPILVTPLYSIPNFLISILQPPDINTIIPLLARFAAAIIAALSVIIVYLNLRALVEKKSALIATVTYAFGTSTWAISSQALWQQGMVELLLALALFVIIRNETKETAWHLVILGIVSGLLAMARPPDALGELRLLPLQDLRRRLPLDHVLDGGLHIDEDVDGAVRGGPRPARHGLRIGGIVPGADVGEHLEDLVGEVVPGGWTQSFPVRSTPGYQLAERPVACAASTVQWR
jgi:hypothetical protein